MRPNDPDRYARELHGDFSEIDTYIKQQYYLIAACGFVLVIFFIVALVI